MCAQNNMITVLKAMQEKGLVDLKSYKFDAVSAAATELVPLLLLHLLQVAAAAH